MKRIYTLIAAMALVIGTLTGCSPSDTTTTTTTTTDTNVPAATGTTN